MTADPTDARFGDADPDDAYDPSHGPDPEQVAYRLHELRAYIEATVHTGLPRWSDLEPAEQELGVAIGGVIVNWLVATDHDDPETAARQLHNVRRYWASSRLDAWDDLDDDDQAVGIALMSAIITWLQHEGTL